MIGALLEKLFVSVGVDLSELKSGMKDTSSEVGKIARDLKSDFEGVGKKWQAVGDGMMKAGAVMTGAVTAPLVLFGKHSAQAAIDAEEMQSAFNVVFGDMAGTMNKWAEDTGNAMGRSTQEMQRGALAFQELFGKALNPKDASEMSKTFAVLTQDLASFKNLSNEVAQQKLFSGLTGEAEPLRAVGVFINDAAVEAKLLAMGIEAVNGKFTDQQKILGRAALIREQLAQADGDVMRTADSTANRIRASQSAWEELSITVGTILIPALTPLIGIVADLLTAFNQLDPETQKFIVAGLGIAAALGPVITIVGGLVSGFGAILPVLAAAVPVVTGFAAGFGAVLVAAAPVVAILAAVAAAGYLIYQNWGEIEPLLTELWSTIQEALGPPFLELVNAAVTALKELWNGPLGEMIRAAVPIILEFQKAWASALGAAFIIAIKAAILVLTEIFKTVGDGIRLVSALLKGDWSGAWDAAVSIVTRAVAPIHQAMSMLVGGIRDWVVGKLNAIWETVKQKIDTVKGWFFGLYDAVVGHSYVPDMVSRIGEEMAKLDKLMVDPAKKATAATKESFSSMASDVKSLLDELFPEIARLGELGDKQALLDKARKAGQIDEGTYRAATDKLGEQRREARTEAYGTPQVIKELEENLAAMVPPMVDLSNVLVPMPEILSDAEMAFAEMGQRLGDDVMAGLRDVLTGRKSLKDMLRDLFSNFLYDTITESLKSLETAIFGEGGLGGFLGGLFSKIIQGRAVGGPVVPGKAYTVGNGELMVPGAHGRVLSRNDAMRAAGNDNGLGSIAVTVNGARGNMEIMEMVQAGVRQGITSYDRGVGGRVQSNLKRRN